MKLIKFHRFLKGKESKEDFLTLCSCQTQLLCKYRREVKNNVSIKKTKTCYQLIIPRHMTHESVRHDDHASVTLTHPVPEHNTPGSSPPLPTN